MLDTHDRIYVAGHRGLAGSALMRQLQANGFERLVTRTHQELDLTDQTAVKKFFAQEQIDVVFLAAARVGGVHANNIYRANFIYENLMIAANVMHQAFTAGVRRLLFLGSSCIYPPTSVQPLREEALLTGALEPTNEPYAIAKIGGIKMCEAYNVQYGTAFRAVMPTNLFGPNDNYDLENSHVLPAIIRKLHLAKKACEGDREALSLDQRRHGPIPPDVRACLDALLEDGGHPALFNTDMESRPALPGMVMWGSGNPLREFLHVDDMAAACLFVMRLDEGRYEQMLAEARISFLNIGAGREISIYDLVQLVAEVVGYEQTILWDESKPDGMARKLMDSSRISELGWEPSISLRHGIKQVYRNFSE